MAVIAVAGTPKVAENFLAALAAVGAQGEAVLEMPDLKCYDGLILPGGVDIDPALFGEENHGSQTIERESDLQQLAILRKFAAAKKPILGVCKGHQLLNVGFGGAICQHIPEFEVHQWLPSGDQSHGSRCLPGCVLARIYGRSEFPVNSAHHQAITVPAEGFLPIQWADDGVLEAHQDLPILGLQWHPERMCLRHKREDTVDGLPVFRWFAALADRKISF